MNLISLILFVITINLDNISLGFLISFQKVKLKLTYQILIVFIINLITYLTLIMGNYLNCFLKTNIISFILLLILSLFTFKNHFQPNKKTKIDKLTLKKIIVLSLLLSLNNVGIGLSYSLQGLNIIWALILNITISYLLLILGFKIGSIKLKFFEKNESLITGILILILALMNLINY